MLLFLSKDDLTLRLKAIHNKDYSVVKTFKAGPSGLVFVLFKLIVPENTVMIFRDDIGGLSCSSGYRCHTAARL